MATWIGKAILKVSAAELGSPPWPPTLCGHWESPCQFSGHWPRAGAGGVLQQQRQSELQEMATPSPPLRRDFPHIFHYEAIELL